VYARVLLPPAEGSPIGDANEARISASVAGTPLAAEPVVWFAESREAIGRGGEVSGGGCAVAGRGAARAEGAAAGNAFAVLAALVLAAAARRRRRARRSDRGRPTVTERS
jgi:hypothetical protein